jgi:polar amino acid transport system permease protein
MSTISPYAIDHLKVVPRRYYGRWLSAALILLALGFVVHAFAHGQIEWAVVAKFMTAKVILQGLLNTILMTVYAMVVGIVLGVVFAVMVMSPNKLLKAVATFYIWFFRGTPLLLQMLLWFNLALVFPTMGIPGWFEARTVDIITPFVASLLGLGIGQGALNWSREVLRECGNMSSATIMFVLQRIMAGIGTGVPRGVPGFAVAFGPGLAAESFRFETVGA